MESGLQDPSGLSERPHLLVRHAPGERETQTRSLGSAVAGPGHSLLASEVHVRRELVAFEHWPRLHFDLPNPIKFENQTPDGSPKNSGTDRSAPHAPSKHENIYANLKKGPFFGGIRMCRIL